MTCLPGLRHILFGLCVLSLSGPRHVYSASADQDDRYLQQPAAPRTPELVSRLSALNTNNNTTGQLFRHGALVILPEDGRSIYLQAFKAAIKEVRIEICVLEDPVILQGIQAALARGVTVRVIVDSGKYNALQSERDNLTTYLLASGGALHLSNPIFPRSFPKVILIDSRYVVLGSACLDSTTFQQYRDYAYVSANPMWIKDLSGLFENDWLYTRQPNSTDVPRFNPTSPLRSRDLLVSPVNSADRLVTFVQQARTTLDLTSELLGSPTLMSELVAAVKRGVRVRLISPLFVNGATPEQQQLQNTSLAALHGAGVQVHVTLPPESADRPYMHARTAVSDGKRLYLGSISLSPDSVTFNREVGVLLLEPPVVRRVKERFEQDWQNKSFPYNPQA